MDAGKILLDFLYHRQHVVLNAAAGRTCDQIRNAVDQIEAAQQLFGNGQLVTRRSRYGDTDRIAEPFMKQRPEGCRTLDG